MTGLKDKDVLHHNLQTPSKSIVQGTKHTRHISRRIHLVRNGEKSNMHKIVWCDGGLKLAEIEGKSVREDLLNTRLGYTMVLLDN